MKAATAALHVPWTFEHDDAETPETLRCLWPFFRFFRVFGMCPMTRKGNEILVCSKTHPSWYFTWFFSFIITTLWINGIYKDLPNARTAGSIVQTINNFIFYSHVMSNCYYMIWKSEEIPRFIKSCINGEEICKSYQEVERKTTGLMRDTYMLFVFTVSAQVIGKALYYVSVAQALNFNSTLDFFETYDEQFQLWKLPKYSGFYYLVVQSYIYVAWSFGDFFLAILCLMMGRLFSRLNKVLANHETQVLVSDMENLRRDHRAICEVVYICNDIFSPLFFITYVFNIVFLFTRLFNGLGHDLKDSHLVVRLEAVYAFIFLIIIKIFLPTYLGAKLHQHAHACLDIIHTWDSSYESEEYREKLLVMGRFVSQLSTTEIGVSGSGFFTITKGFFLTLLGALITYEVIILQFQAKDFKEDS